jgi:uncharacterized protein
MVRLQAGARKDEIVGCRDQSLLVRVSAPPREGRANRALCELLARRVGVPRSAVRIRRGARSRDKLVSIAGTTPDELRAALSGDARA